MANNNKKKEECRNALAQAEAEYLTACGWVLHKTTPKGNIIWIAPKFAKYPHWNGAYPGDKLLHANALVTQKNYDEFGS